MRDPPQKLYPNVSSDRYSPTLDLSPPCLLNIQLLSGDKILSIDFVGSPWVFTNFFCGWLQSAGNLPTLNFCRMIRHHILFSFRYSCQHTLQWFSSVLFRLTSLLEQGCYRAHSVHLFPTTTLAWNNLPLLYLLFFPHKDSSICSISVIPSPVNLTFSAGNFLGIFFLHTILCTTYIWCLRTDLEVSYK